MRGNTADCMYCVSDSLLCRSHYTAWWQIITIKQNRDIPQMPEKTSRLLAVSPANTNHVARLTGLRPTLYTQTVGEASAEQEATYLVQYLSHHLPFTIHHQTYWSKKRYQIKPLGGSSVPLMKWLLILFSGSLPGLLFCLHVWPQRRGLSNSTLIKPAICRCVE